MDPSQTNNAKYAGSNIDSVANFFHKLPIIITGLVEWMEQVPKRRVFEFITR